MDNPAIKTLLGRFPCLKIEATGNIRTCPVRLSFPNIFKPGKAMEEGKEPKYGVTLLFPRGANIALLRSAAEATAAEKFGNDWKSRRLTFPFRDQGEKSFAGYEAGCVFLNATSTKRPGVINRDGSQLSDPEALYPGVWALVTLRPFAYDSKLKKGISFGLQNVQKLCDGERLSGGYSDPSKDFGPIDGLDDIDALLAGSGNGGSEGGEAYDFG